MARKRLTLEQTWGYRTNQKLDYYRPTKRPVVYIIAHKFYQKAIARALHNDFNFTVNGTVDRYAWDRRNIRYVRSHRTGLKEWFKRASRSSLGSVFIVCGNRQHRPAIYVDRDKHLVLLVPPITNTTWPKLGMFKKAAEYLNIDKDIFRPS